MALPAVLLVALALTLEGGEDALAALIGRVLEPGPQIATAAPGLPIVGLPVAASVPTVPKSDLSPPSVVTAWTSPDPDRAPMTDAPLPSPVMAVAIPLLAQPAEPRPRAMEPADVARYLPHVARPLLPPAPAREAGIDLASTNGFALPVVRAAPPPRWETAAEVRPLLTQLGSRLLQLRPWEGREHLLFSGLTTFRCGMTAVHYGINGAAPDTSIRLEPCYTDTATPYAQPHAEDYTYDLPFPNGTVQAVTIRITFDDGTTEIRTFDRAAILTAG